MRPVIVDSGDSPVILAMPHVGQDLPESLARRLNPLGLRTGDTDWNVDELYHGLLASPTIVKATFSRYVIDANRDPSGQSLYPGQHTTGLCPTMTFDGQSIYLKGQQPGEAEISERLAHFHRPYHQALGEQIERVQARHGVAVLYDCHSIRSHIPYLFAGELPVFNIGSADGETCHNLVEEAAVAVCRSVSKYPNVLNGRFKGGWTTRLYGRPRQGVHAIQMELAQRAYMNESPPWGYRGDLADQIRPYLRQILSNIEQLAVDGRLHT